MSRAFKLLKNSEATNPFAGATEKDLAVAQVALKKLYHDVFGDPILPTEILAGGKTLWINTFLREFTSFRLVDREIAETFWRGCQDAHGKRFPGLTPKQVLDNWHEATPASAADIRKAFKFETASSYEARTRYYGPDGNPDNVFRQLVDQIPDDQLVKAARGEGDALEALTPPADDTPRVTLE